MPDRLEITLQDGSVHRVAVPEARSVDGYLDHLLGGGRLEGLLGVAGTPAWVRVEAEDADEKYVSYGAIVAITLFRDTGVSALAAAERAEEPELVFERPEMDPLQAGLAGEPPIP